MGAAGRTALGAQAKELPRLENVRKGPFATTEKLTPYEDVTGFTNFYEFGTEQVRAGQARRQPAPAAVDGACGRRGGAAGPSTPSRTS